MNCGECQAVIPEDSEFCPECGARVGGVQAAAPAVEAREAIVAPAASVEEAPVPPERKIPIRSLAIGAAGLALLALGWIVFGRDNEANPVPPSSTPPPLCFTTTEWMGKYNAWEGPPDNVWIAEIHGRAQCPNDIQDRFETSYPEEWGDNAFLEAYEDCLDNKVDAACLDLDQIFVELGCQNMCIGGM